MSGVYIIKACYGVRAKATADFFLDDDGNVQGPYERETMLEWLESDFLAGTDLHLQVNADSWQRLMFPEFALQNSTDDAKEWFYVDENNESVARLLMKNIDLHSNEFINGDICDRRCDRLDTNGKYRCSKKRRNKVTRFGKSFTGNRWPTKNRRLRLFETKE